MLIVLINWIITNNSKAKISVLQYITTPDSGYVKSNSRIVMSKDLIRPMPSHHTVDTPTKISHAIIDCRNSLVTIVPSQRGDVSETNKHITEIRGDIETHCEATNDNRHLISFHYRQESRLHASKDIVRFIERVAHNIGIYHSS